jgi:hypothetical protein
MSDLSNTTDAELIDAEGNVIQFPTEQQESDSQSDDDDVIPKRGCELGSMRQVLRQETKIYRMLERKKISAADAERHVKILGVIFDQHKFLDVERGIMERLARLEEARGLAHED